MISHLGNALTLSRAITRDCIGRAAIWVLAASIGLAMLMVRWLSIQGTGEELSLLKEFTVLNLGIGGALCVILCSVPSRRVAMVCAAERALQTRAISPITLPLAKWIAAAFVSALLFLVWSGIAALVLIWFEYSEGALFYYMTPDTSPIQEISSLAFPVLMAWLQTLMLAGVAVAFSRKGSLLSCAAAVMATLLLASLIPTFASAEGSSSALSVAAMLLPDLRLYAPGSTLFAEHELWSWLMGGALQAFGYAGFALLAASAAEVARR